MSFLNQINNTSSYTSPISFFMTPIWLRTRMFTALSISFLFGLFFILTQIYEYYILSLPFKHNIYGTVFYSLTGLHGMHVMVGLILIFFTCYFFGIRVPASSFNNDSYVGIISAMWYWHFVDIVWIILYIFVYTLFAWDLGIFLLAHN